MLSVSFDSSPITMDDSYLGDGYPIPSTDSLNAVEVFAETDGLLFDPIYVGKAAAALIGYVRNGELENSENVLLIHTGGNGGIYY